MRVLATDHCILSGMHHLLSTQSEVATDLAQLACRMKRVRAEESFDC